MKEFTEKIAKFSPSKLSTFTASWICYGNRHPCLNEHCVTFMCIFIYNSLICLLSPILKHYMTLVLVVYTGQTVIFFGKDHVHDCIWYFELIRKIHWSCLFHKMFGWLGTSTPLDLYNYSFIKIGQFKSNRDWYQIRNKGISGTSFTFQINQGFCKGALRFGVFVFLLHLTMFLYTTLSGVNQLDQVIINYTKPFYSNWKTLCYYNSLR